MAGPRCAAGALQKTDVVGPVFCGHLNQQGFFFKFVLLFVLLNFINIGCIRIDILPVGFLFLHGVCRASGKRGRRVLVLSKLPRRAVLQGKWPEAPWPLVLVLKPLCWGQSRWAGVGAAGITARWVPGDGHDPCPSQESPSVSSCPGVAGWIAEGSVVPLARAPLELLWRCSAAARQVGGTGRDPEGLGHWEP